MNEQSPERRLFQPSERYLANVLTAVNRIFASPPPPPVEGVEVPEMAIRRSWRKNGFLFLAMIVDPRQTLLVSEGIEDDQVVVMRINPDDEGFYAVRSYLYYRNTGEMQVANWLYTSEEVEEMDFISPEGQELGQAITEGFDQHIYTASEVDYLDFLADLDGFRESFEI